MQSSCQYFFYLKSFHHPLSFFFFPSLVFLIVQSPLSMSALVQWATSLALPHNDGCLDGQTQACLTLSVSLTLSLCLPLLTCSLCRRAGEGYNCCTCGKDPNILFNIGMGQPLSGRFLHGPCLLPSPRIPPASSER